mgnify:FL=1
MEKKTTAKVEETKAAAKAAESKAAVKVEETQAAAKAVEAKVAAKVEETKAAAKEAEAKVAEKAEEVVKETKKRKPRTKTAKKAAKEELKPGVYVEYQGNSALVEAAIEKAKEKFVAEGHRASSIKSLQIYLKPEDYAAYYVINQKNSGKVDLF